MSDLEQTLAEIAREHEGAPAPDLAGAVAARLRAQRLRWTAQIRRRVAIALVLALVLPAGAVAAVSPVRETVLDALGIRGVRIERTTEPVRAPAQLAPDLGRRIAPGQAADAVDFDLVTADARLGQADDAYVRSLPSGSALTLVYTARTGRRLLLTQFRGASAPALLGKVAGPGTAIRRVNVDGERGAWLSGRPHRVAYLDARGRLQVDRLRLAGDTLLWQRGPITLRLEGAASLSGALDIARGVR